MTREMEIIPELSVADPAAARAMLAEVFGFAVEGDRMVLGSQRIALRAATGPRGHGKIDHLALAVTDIDATLARVQAQGGLLEATTPDGPREIAEFWEAGVRYVFLQGPEGARIEYCARLPQDHRAGLPGHDHIGVPCTDIDASEAFLRGLGLLPLAAVDLTRADGVTAVRFLAAGDSVVELYGPPQLRGAVPDFTPEALWSGLQLHGSGQAPGLRLGPDGLRVTVI
jgi:catechol 2,3-dioxygenase-like lactoylglutathione lyase family enzyme